MEGTHLPLVMARGTPSGVQSWAVAYSQPDLTARGSWKHCPKNMSSLEYQNPRPAAWPSHQGALLGSWLLHPLLCPPPLPWAFAISVCLSVSLNFETITNFREVTNMVQRTFFFSTELLESKLPPPLNTFLIFLQGLSLA